MAKYAIIVLETHRRYSMFPFNMLYDMYEMGMQAFQRGDIMFGVISFILLIGFPLLVALVVATLLGAIYDLIDTAGLPEEMVRGRILEKNYTPAHTTMILSGKVLVPIYHPNRWSAVIEVPDATEEIEITEEIYDEIRIDSEMDVYTVIGRLSKTVRIVGY